MFRTRTRKKQAARTSSFKPQLEPLEKREVMSVTAAPINIVQTAGLLAAGNTPPAPTAAGLALINSLPDTPVRSTALADYQRDGQITRNDMIDVFFSATNDYTYLLPGALQSVQTLVSNGNVLSMPDYVQNLSSKVIAGVSGLGQAPAQTINQHVNNFFLGLVRPDPGTYTIYTTPQKVVPGMYDLVSAPLWSPAHGPSHLDVHYNYNGDAGLVWALQDVTYRTNDDIFRMFIDNGDGTYTVRLYNSQTHEPDYVTVDSYLPFKPSNIVDAQNNPLGQVLVGGADVKPYLWPALVEKAFAQEYGLSYAALNRVSEATAWYSFTGLSIHSSTSIDPTAIADAVNGGSFVVLNGNDALVETTNNDVFWFRGDFIILGTPAPGTDWFSLRNVGGVGYVVEVSPSEMSQFFKSWYQVTGVDAAARISTIVVSALTGLSANTLTQAPTSSAQDMVYDILRKLPTKKPAHSSLYASKAMLRALAAAQARGDFFLPLASTGTSANLLGGTVAKLA